MEVLDMSSDVDPGTIPEPGMVSDDFVQLTIHILFDRLPMITNPDDGSNEFSMKPISPVVRFPVKLSTKDAGVVEEALYTALVAGVALQFDNADGSPRHYRLFRTQ
jgi:hypothetical protein